VCWSAEKVEIASSEGRKGLSKVMRKRPPDKNSVAFRACPAGSDFKAFLIQGF